MKIFVNKIKAKNFLSYYELNANFDDKLLTILTDTETFSETPNVLPVALDFLMDPKFISSKYAIYLLSPDAPLNQAHVTIDFRICPSEKETFYIKATRMFSRLAEIIVKREGSVTTEPIRDFQKRFKTHISYFYPFVYFELDANWGSRNCLDFFMYQRLNNVNKTTKTVLGLWNDNNNTLSDDVNPEDFKNMIDILHQLRPMEERLYLKSLIDLANKVNEVFQQLTAKRYSIQFKFKTDKLLNDLIAEEDLESALQDITTIIRSRNDDIIWIHANDALKSIVKIATKIALALHLGCSLVFLGKIDELCDQIEMDTVTTGIIQQEDGSTPERLDLIHNLIDICNFYNLQIFVEYNGSVTAENCNIYGDNKIDDLEMFDAIDFYIEDILEELNKQLENVEESEISGIFPVS